jgi:hypothetical protein
MTNKVLSTASNNTFSVTFNKIPMLSSLLQNVNFPSVDMNLGEVTWQGMKMPADTGTIGFGPLTLQIRLDEYHEIVKQVYQWAGLMHGNSAIDGRAEVSMEEKREDLYIHVLNSNNRELFKYHFVGCVLSAFDIDPFVRGQSEKLVGTITLNFDYFVIV